MHFFQVSGTLFRKGQSPFPAKLVSSLLIINYLFKVPYLKEAGPFMNTHGIVGGTSISRVYVTDKYVGEDGGHYVDLTGWVKDLEGNIMQELAFTVLLPSRMA